ncbi:EFR1 family ferrodoxin [Miniphocaeibacter massiliensis]|uniref:EFR1 family ferrodoxin n=1 Tax=Miniphocaeibacter massiliensis TaxID=2041841 RepID=UPI000C07066D|nr:EFR1 family ferrodoxin [Miniphocaeibacter massiliensis]
MLGLYFSGTGNSKLCLEIFLKNLNNDYSLCSIEDSNAKSLIEKSEEIILSYPVYYSNLPLILKDFLLENSSLFYGKKIFIIATMGLFSGDGTGCSARILEKYGAVIIGGLHIKMPDCIIDVKILKKSSEQEDKLLKNTKLKIEKSANLYSKNCQTQQGLGVFSHIAGLLGQRLWFKKMTSTYKKYPKIDYQKCINCNNCIAYCPMKNLYINSLNQIDNLNKCTLCYRCVHVCPKKAITILGKNIVHKQSQFLNKKS